MSGKLVRRESDSKITGVCAAIGRYFNVDPTVVRIFFVLASFFEINCPIKNEIEIRNPYHLIFIKPKFKNVSPGD